MPDATVMHAVTANAVMANAVMVHAPERPRADITDRGIDGPGRVHVHFLLSAAEMSYKRVTGDPGPKGAANADANERDNPVAGCIAVAADGKSLTDRGDEMLLAWTQR